MCTHRLGLTTSCIGIVLTSVPSALAVDREWVGGGPAPTSWHDPFNWSPSGVPVASDAVDIVVDKVLDDYIVNLDGDTALIDSLWVQGITANAIVSTLGFRLYVSALDTTGVASIIHDGKILVYPVTGELAGLVVDNLNVFNGGNLTLTNGAMVYVGDQMLVRPAGSVSGNGELLLPQIRTKQRTTLAQSISSRFVLSFVGTAMPMACLILRTPFLP